MAITVLLASSLSFAGDRGNRDEEQRGRGNSHQRDDRRDGGQFDQRDERGNERQFDQRDGRRNNNHLDQRDGRWNDRRPDYNARGPEFRRGGTIAHEYRGRGYEVDYREHHLSRPPQGQRWVQVGADYVLIAIATGLIASIILSR